LIDALLGWIGQYFQVPDLSLVKMLGYLLYPVAFLLGTPTGEVYKVAQLIGIKIIQNEFVAYIALSSDPLYKELSPRAQLIATYALCGFGNIGALGIQIGILGQLAPDRKKDFSRIGFSAVNLVTDIESG
jgi:concentrative nucleoside transporter, CNT family